ncbi:MAG: tetratricopeptide repeat protein [Chloroflexi bacterium]|nr:tetratricopeptide repeat protein [Chloroflexota bacterium]
MRFRVWVVLCIAGLVLVMGTGAALTTAAPPGQAYEPISPANIQHLTLVDEYALATPIDIWSITFHRLFPLLASGSADGVVRLWDYGGWGIFDTGDVLEIDAHDFDVTSVTFNTDGAFLVSGGWDGHMRVWDARTGDEVNDFYFGEPVYAVAMHSRDPFLAATATGYSQNAVYTSYIFETSVYATFSGHYGWVQTVAFHPDGTQLASAGDDTTIRLWDLATGQTVRTFDGHTWVVGSVTFSPDGMQLASASLDGTVRLWDAATAEPLRVLEADGPLWQVAYSPDGQLVAAGGRDGAITVWSVETGERLLTLPAHDGWTHTVAFSPDGRLLASAGEDGRIRLWAVPEGGSVTDPAQLFDEAGTAMLLAEYEDAISRLDVLKRIAPDYRADEVEATLREALVQQARIYLRDQNDDGADRLRRGIELAQRAAELGDDSLLYEVNFIERYLTVRTMLAEEEVNIASLTIVEGLCIENCAWSYRGVSVSDLYTEVQRVLGSPPCPDFPTLGEYYSDQTTRNNPFAFRSYYGLALLWQYCILSDDIDDTLRYYDRAITLEPDLPEFYVDRGLLYLDFDNYDDALADFEIALELDPGREEAIYWREYTLVAMGADASGAGE